MAFTNFISLTGLWFATLLYALWFFVVENWAFVKRNPLLHGFTYWFCVAGHALSLGTMLRWNLKVSTGLFWAQILPRLTFGFLNSLYIYAPTFECLNFPKSLTQILLGSWHGLLYICTHNTLSRYMWVYSPFAVVTSRDHHSSSPKSWVMLDRNQFFSQLTDRLEHCKCYLLYFLQFKEGNWELCYCLLMTKVTPYREGARKGWVKMPQNLLPFWMWGFLY